MVISFWDASLQNDGHLPPPRFFSVSRYAGRVPTEPKNADLTIIKAPDAPAH